MALKTGSVESTLDDKGRVNIPVRFREQYQGPLIITRGYEQPCVWVMTVPLFENFKRNIINKEKHSQVERIVLEEYYINEAQDVEIDKAGRIAIPATLRKDAGLNTGMTKNCLVISAETRLAIWDSDVREAYLAKNEALAQAAIDKLGSQDIFGAGEG